MKGSYGSFMSQNFKFVLFFTKFCLRVKKEKHVSERVFKLFRSVVQCVLKSNLSFLKKIQFQGKLLVEICSRNFSVQIRSWKEINFRVAMFRCKKPTNIARCIGTPKSEKKPTSDRISLPYKKRSNRRFSLRFVKVQFQLYRSISLQVRVIICKT